MQFAGKTATIAGKNTHNRWQKYKNTCSLQVKHPQSQAKKPAIAAKNTRNCKRVGLHSADEVTFNLPTLLHAVACFLPEQLAA